jgi:hypothetical protein
MPITPNIIHTMKHTVKASVLTISTDSAWPLLVMSLLLVSDGATVGSRPPGAASSVRGAGRGQMERCRHSGPSFGRTTGGPHGAGLRQSSRPGRARTRPIDGDHRGCTRELTSSLRRMCCTWILTVVSAMPARGRSPCCCRRGDGRAGSPVRAATARPAATAAGGGRRRQGLPRPRGSHQLAGHFVGHHALAGMARRMAADSASPSMVFSR